MNPPRQCTCYEEDQLHFIEKHPVCCIAGCEGETTSALSTTVSGRPVVVWTCDAHSDYTPSPALCKECLHYTDDHNYRPGRTARVCLHRKAHNSPAYDVCGCESITITDKDYKEAGLTRDDYLLYLAGEFDEV